MFTWRGLMPAMLEWMTPRLADVVAVIQARAQDKARRAAAAQHKKSATRHHT